MFTEELRLESRRVTSLITDIETDEALLVPEQRRYPFHLKKPCWCCLTSAKEPYDDSRLRHRRLSESSKLESLLGLIRST